MIYIIENCVIILWFVNNIIVKKLHYFVNRVMNLYTYTHTFVYFKLTVLSFYKLHRR